MLARVAVLAAAVVARPVLTFAALVAYMPMPRTTGQQPQRVAAAQAGADEGHEGQVANHHETQHSLPIRRPGTRELQCLRSFFCVRSQTSST